MTHNDIAVLVCKAIHQEEKRMPNHFNLVLREDFREWDNGGLPSRRMVSALNQLINEHMDFAEYGSVTLAIKILENQIASQPLAT